MVWIDLIYNLALLVALSVVSGFVGSRWTRTARLGAMLQGVVFGGAAVIGMLRPFVFAPGLIFDGRSVMISLGGFFFGPWTAVVACLMTIPLRLVQGGPGALMGVLVILASAGIGVGYYLRRPPGAVEAGTRTLLGFGVVVHIAMLAMTLALPPDMILAVLKRIGWPVMLIYPLATVLIGKVLSDQAARNGFLESLQKSEARFAKMYHANPAGIGLNTMNEGRLIDVNARFCEFFGYQHEEAVGRTIFELGLWADPSRREPVLRELRKTGLVRDAAIQLRRKDGEVRDVLMSMQLFDLEGESEPVILAMFIDITERRRAEEALRDSEQLLKESQRIAKLGSYRLNISTGLWQSSAVLDEVFGIDEAYDRSVEGWIALIHPDDRAMMTDYFRNEVLTAGRTFDKSYRIIRHGDQAECWVHGMGKVEFDAQRQPLKMYGTIQDITERKRLEAERMEMESQMRHQQKLEAIGTLAGGVAHEINNPIMGVMNYAQLIADQTGANNPVNDYAREIIHEIERVAGIVRNLLQFARQEKQSHSPAHIQDIVTQTLSLVRAVMRHDHIILKVEIPPELPTLKCRSQEIQQVLMNLLTNARDALNDKYPGHHDDKVINVTCRMFHREDRRWLRLTVEDRGNGVAAAVRDRIFDPFFTTKPRDKGTGLGLSISRSIVKEHHGQLLFETELGRFTRFHVELPVDNGWELPEKGAPETQT